MANLTLAPEDDDSYAALNLPSSTRRQIEGIKLPETQKLHGCFDPQKVGFGILAPWPGTELAVRTKECTVAANSFDANNQDSKDAKEQK